MVQAAPLCVPMQTSRGNREDSTLARRWPRVHLEGFLHRKVRYCTLARLQLARLCVLQPLRCVRHTKGQRALHGAHPLERSKGA